jgi:hypothetical protein
MTTVKKDAIYGIFDQGLISLSNLVIGFLLIKLTNKENYGLPGTFTANHKITVAVAFEPVDIGLRSDPCIHNHLGARWLVQAG